jgi:hypothetical protein
LISSASDSHSKPESEDFGRTVFVVQEVDVLRGKVVKWECLIIISEELK